MKKLRKKIAIYITTLSCLNSAAPSDVYAMNSTELKKANPVNEKMLEAIEGHVEMDSKLNEEKKIIKKNLKKVKSKIMEEKEEKEIEDEGLGEEGNEISDNEEGENMGKKEEEKTDDKDLDKDDEEHGGISDDEVSENSGEWIKNEDGSFVNKKTSEILAPEVLQELIKKGEVKVKKKFKKEVKNEKELMKKFMNGKEILEALEKENKTPIKTGEIGQCPLPIKKEKEGYTLDIDAIELEGSYIRNKKDETYFCLEVKKPNEEDEFEYAFVWSKDKTNAIKIEDPTIFWPKQTNQSQNYNYNQNNYSTNSSSYSGYSSSTSSSEKKSSGAGLWIGLIAGTGALGGIGYGGYKMSGSEKKQQSKVKSKFAANVKNKKSNYGRARAL